jgi:hypothetical protein
MRPNPRYEAFVTHRQDALAAIAPGDRGFNFGGGNAQLDLEAMAFDWACG